MLGDRHQGEFRDDGDSRFSDAERGDAHQVHVLAGNPEGKLHLEAPAKPSVELVIECKSLVRNMLQHGFEAIARRHDFFDLTNQQHQALRLAGC